MKRSLPLSLLLALGFSLGAQELSLIPPFERPRLVKGTHVPLCSKSSRFKPAEGIQPGTFKMLLAENRFPELGREGSPPPRDFFGHQIGDDSLRGDHEEEGRISAGRWREGRP